jgi:hypothetical protein
MRKTAALSAYYLAQGPVPAWLIPFALKEANHNQPLARPRRDHLDTFM